MTSNLTYQPPQVSSYCSMILSTLFRDMDVMSQLVLHFQNKEQIIAHLAAKSVSASVFYHIHTSGMVPPVWLRSCVQAFHSSTPGFELDACLWSLTEVLKKLLKGPHQEILREVVAALDSSLCALCSRFFAKNRTSTQSLVDVTEDDHWKTSFCLLPDLLEVLTASSFITGAGVYLKSQRLAILHSSALLYTISCSSWYCVKKQVVLLLKRAVLQKAGEDWALEEGFSIGLKHENLSSDLIVLADTVLSAVAANWLQSIQVESASFFGGTRYVGHNREQKEDFVILRAVSLLLLRSIKLRMQTGNSSAHVDSPLQHLHKLWEFVRSCIVHLSETTHICLWVSAVFAEQDDDMMEAAKDLLSIFLHHRMSSTLEESDLLEAACASGFNPHCHFLFLLQSVSFDHSILLDFLISTETCFLEYFVRYLKYLTVYWQDFTSVCRRVSMSDTHLGFMRSYVCSGRSDISALTPNNWPQMEKGCRLVEYDSSESDQENTDISEDEPEMLMCQNRRLTASCFKQGIIRQQIKQPQRRSLNSVSSQQTSANIAGCETLARAVLCFSELKDVVTRLHTKKLFPYNPSSLLKLLAQVQKCS
ncbi:protein Lines homolog 1 isoform X2 [Betta splendens]|nr:protein Lines homolog 1 isoform X2 [Betta splendens]